MLSEHPFAQCQNMMPRNPHVLLEKRRQGGLNPAQIRPTSRTHADWRSLNPPNSANRMQLLQTPEVSTAVDFMFSEDPLESVSLQSNRPFMGQHKKAKETQTYLPELTENSLSGTTRNTVLTPTAVQIPPDEKEVSEEVQLQQLVMKLEAALSLQAQPGISAPSYLDTVFSLPSSLLYNIVHNHLTLRGNSESCLCHCRSTPALYCKVEHIPVRWNIAPNVGLIWNRMS